LKEAALKDIAITQTHTYSEEEPEVKTVPNSSWVIATFDHFLVIPISGDDMLLYTEMHFDITELVQKPKSGTLVDGGSFDVDLVGGRIKASDGSIHSLGVSPQQYFVQPGHTYLLQLTPAPSGNFYFINKQWDVSSGKVVPDRSDEVRRASKGLSKLDGMPLSKVSTYIRSVVPVVND
jgi:hypothetical protein